MPLPRSANTISLTVRAVLAGVVLAACATTAPGTSAGRTGVVRVVAAENFWGSLAAQLGGEHVTVTSIIDNPDADPHDYEPTAADGADLRRRPRSSSSTGSATTPGRPGWRRQAGRQPRPC